MRKSRLLLMLVAGVAACAVYAPMGPREAPAIANFDERLVAECGDASPRSKCEALAADTSRMAARCTRLQDDASHTANMPDCSDVNHQLASVRTRLAAVRQPAQKPVLTSKVEEPPPDNSWANPYGPRSVPQSTPEPDNGPCKAEKQTIVPERDESGMPTGKMIAFFPGSRTWTDATGARISQNCTPSPAEIALLPAKDRRPLTEAEIKAQVAAVAARPKSEIQQETEDDMAYRRAHGQAPGQTPIPAGHYEVTGVH